MEKILQVFWQMWLHVEMYCAGGLVVDMSEIILVIYIYIYYIYIYRNIHKSCTHTYIRTYINT